MPRHKRSYNKPSNVTFRVQTSQHLDLDITSAEDCKRMARKRHFNDDVKSNDNPDDMPSMSKCSSNGTPHSLSDRESYRTINDEVSKSSVFENIVLEPLKKLKQFLWDSDYSEEECPYCSAEAAGDRNYNNIKEYLGKTVGENPDLRTNKASVSFAPSLVPSLVQTLGPNTDADEAKKIVSSALEFGVTNGLVTKKGQCYWLNAESKISKRSLTPGLALKNAQSIHSSIENLTKEKKKIKSRKKWLKGISSFSSLSASTQFSESSAGLNSLANDDCQCRRCTTMKSKRLR